MATIKEIMISNPLMLKPEQSVFTARELMIINGFECLYVVDKTGMEEFNAVWSGPEALPSKAEITDPDTWIARVL